MRYHKFTFVSILLGVGLGLGIANWNTQSALQHSVEESELSPRILELRIDKERALEEVKSNEVKAKMDAKFEQIRIEESTIIKRSISQKKASL